MDNGPNNGWNNNQNGSGNNPNPVNPNVGPSTNPALGPAPTPPSAASNSMSGGPISFGPGIDPTNRPTLPTGRTTGQVMIADNWVKNHWKLLLLIFIALVVLGQTIFQIVYPSNRLIPGTVVDGEQLGGKRYDEASEHLNKLYGQLPLKIYFGKNEAAFQTPKMEEVGIGVDNGERLEKITYPMYLRFIPFSMFWAPAISQPGEIKYVYDKKKISAYTNSKVGEDCTIPPQNATLKLNESKLEVVPSVAGGKCDINDLQEALANVKPGTMDGGDEVRVAIDETPAPVTDEMARDLAAKLNSRMAVPMPITVDKEVDNIPGRVVLSWLDFEADVPEDRIDKTASDFARLLYLVNQKRMEDYLNQGIAAKLIKEPGVSRVSTLDFKETSRVNGANGRGVDMEAAAKSVVDYIEEKIGRAVAVTKVVGPTTVYTRKYTPTSVGFSALLAQYAQDNPGVYGLAFQELSGVRYPRSASYRGDARMGAGGIHSVYLAYTYIMEEHAGKSRPVDKISGEMNAIECFDEMLQRFDYGCRTGFYRHFGHATLTKRGKELGLKNTVFASEDTVTSANDLKKLFVGLYKNEIARLEGGQKILSALRGTQASEGFPAGVVSGQISHVIGENEGIHNDGGVIYSTNRGAYALVVLSDGTEWEHVKKLVEKIEALKAVKIPEGAR